MRCPYFIGCPHYAGLLFTGFTVYKFWNLCCTFPVLPGGWEALKARVCSLGNTADRQPQRALTYFYLSQSTASQNEKLIHCHPWGSNLQTFGTSGHLSDLSAKSHPQALLYSQICPNGHLSLTAICLMRPVCFWPSVAHCQSQQSVLKGHLTNFWSPGWPLKTDLTVLFIIAWWLHWHGWGLCHCIWNTTTYDLKGNRLLAYFVPSMYLCLLCIYVSTYFQLSADIRVRGRLRLPDPWVAGPVRVLPWRSVAEVGGTAAGQARWAVLGLRGRGLLLHARRRLLHSSEDEGRWVVG
jgi:hypothetical protein